jgi:tetratricopeptide (TPR) repeat protein
MAVSKKDKLIEDAQKFAANRQFDKAAKAYEQILALEPSAINQRQKLAELLIKCGLNEDARKELETVGKHFSKNGFYLKSIAVYKQLQKLFPADISLSLTLAELNEKHGLVANALSEYKLVYDFHEKAGNIPESLAILDRMQNVDPNNIPIKTKLAEAFVLQGKKEEAYTLYAKIVSLLLERKDNATLAKICGRIQQLFPGKPDFMIEILAVQISQGNAGSAIDTLQSLLRGNPNNKRVWDLIVKAYQQLDQPQRVKIAYQHYLKFFPAEPEAMSGLISMTVAEQNLAGAVELLDQYESTLISAGFLQQLEHIYHSLDKLDPINTRVLEGLVRVTTAAGNESEAHSHAAKLKSLRSLSGGTAETSGDQETVPGFFDDHSFDYPDSDHSDTPAEQAAMPYLDAPQTEVVPETSFAMPYPGTAADTIMPPEEDIEIDIELDIDSPFDIQDVSPGTTSAHDNWLDSVGDLFDAIDTAPRGVKFGNDMESSDAQSHFDLGQAFKEMGLYDEAINEFRQASQDTARRIECLIMQCICLRERGEVEKAITMLGALLKPGLSDDECCAVKYELATAYETAGKVEESNVLLNEIYSANPGFRDIDSRLNAANRTESLDFSDEDLDVFGLG